MTDRVTIDINNGIADVRFNRPDKHNALDKAQFQAVCEAGMSLQNRKDVRVVVLSGNGPSFCSGLDYFSFTDPKDINIAFEHNHASAPANNAQTCGWIWRQLPMPVIAALHGYSYGGGFQIAMGADIRIAKPDARFCIMEMEYGLIPDMAITATLRRSIPLDVLKELTFTARKFDAEEAKQLSIITQLADDPLAAAMALAEQIAQRSPDAVRACKTLLEEAWDDDIAKGLHMEAEIQRRIIGQPNQVEAVMAKIERRAANYQD